MMEEAYLAHVRVEVLEPRPKLLIHIRVVNQGMSGIKDNIHALPVHETFKQRAQF